mmetsp:Transcript_17414/g.21438  ORF Transcript_17414/g.21438 Transcript_17414/m.21438 type:complete len:265 (-) Transcript_17414:727-1521(-)
MIPLKIFITVFLLFSSKCFRGAFASSCSVCDCHRLSCPEDAVLTGIGTSLGGVLYSGQLSYTLQGVIDGSTFSVDDLVWMEEITGNIIQSYDAVFFTSKTPLNRTRLDNEAKTAFNSINHDQDFPNVEINSAVLSAIRGGCVCVAYGADVSLLSAPASIDNYNCAGSEAVPLNVIMTTAENNTADLTSKTVATNGPGIVGYATALTGTSNVRMMGGICPCCPTNAPTSSPTLAPTKNPTASTASTFSNSWSLHVLAFLCLVFLL